MIRILLFCSMTILMMSQMASADDSSLAQKNGPQPANVEQKSFFESRTIEDILRLVHIDTKLMEGSSDLSSHSSGAG